MARCSQSWTRRFLFLSLALVTVQLAGDTLLARDQGHGPVAPGPTPAGTDLHVQGEYRGATYTDRYGAEAAGLQIVALGNREFRAVQFRRGLPGAGWNRVDQFDLQRNDRWHGVRLGDQQFSISICGGVATLRNSANQLVGRLHRQHRCSPTLGRRPPPGAVTLFDGTSTEHFAKGEATPDGLLMAGALSAAPVSAFFLRVEFRTSYRPVARGQARGNSGVYIQERYEVQILDSFGNQRVFDECGALYKTRPPDVNICFPPLAWQTYDIEFSAPRWSTDGTRKIRNAQLTVVHNGVRIHDNVEIPDKTGEGKPEGPEPRPIRFQDHCNPVHFRNIWIVHN